jgi:sugar/nucleoside kinase (ribokinase family)
LHRILARTTWLSANRSEVDIMTAGASDGARPLLARMGQDARGVVLRAGARGCRVFLKDGACADLPGFEVDVVDTNGAGDTHAGAFVGALATGADPGQAALYANTAAAIPSPGKAVQPHRTRARSARFFRSAVTRPFDRTEQAKPPTTDREIRQ